MYIRSLEFGHGIGIVERSLLHWRFYIICCILTANCIYVFWKLFIRVQILLDCKCLYSINDKRLPTGCRKIFM